MTSSASFPAARYPSTRLTGLRVPLIRGFPRRNCGSLVMYFFQSVGIRLSIECTKGTLKGFSVGSENDQVAEVHEFVPVNPVQYSAENVRSLGGIFVVGLIHGASFLTEREFPGVGLGTFMRKSRAASPKTRRGLWPAYMPRYGYGR